MKPLLTKRNIWYITIRCYTVIDWAIKEWNCCTKISSFACFSSLIMLLMLLCYVNNMNCSFAFVPKYLQSDVKEWSQVTGPIWVLPALEYNYSFTKMGVEVLQNFPSIFGFFVICLSCITLCMRIWNHAERQRAKQEIRKIIFMTLHFLAWITQKSLSLLHHLSYTVWNNTVNWYKYVILTPY